ncbi:MAG: C4-type zinc ribbon domain-containing protein [Verrucomicrobiae bacterium]|nr:C4-type zinc ribbon domain-containing protein [Verrucomicrobiae bacterium]
MNDTIRNLFKLQTLEFDEPVRPNTEEQIAELRTQIPPAVLSHYDRLGDSGKKGVAMLRHQVCTGCHLQVPLHVVLELKHGDELRLCDNCRRYLYLEEEAPVVPLASVKTAAKPHRRQLAHAR